VFASSINSIWYCILSPLIEYNGDLKVYSSPRLLPQVHFCLVESVFEDSLTALWTSNADKGSH